MRGTVNLCETEYFNFYAVYSLFSADLPLSALFP